MLDLESNAPLSPPKTSSSPAPVEFDQILDLTNEDCKSSPPPAQLAAPLIAFEDSITPSPKQEVPTAGIFATISKRITQPQPFFNFQISFRDQDTYSAE